MAGNLDILLHSDYSPEMCLARLAEQIDVDDRTLFSLSGYKGRRAVVGRIEGSDFRLHKRRYWHNSFGPVLFGRMMPDGRGTRIEAFWDVWRSVRIFVRVWIVLTAIMGTPILFNALRCAVSKACADQGDSWLGLIVPPAMILWGILLPRIGALLGLHEKKAIVELLERTLVAGKPAVSAQERTWESSLDTFRL